MHPQAFQYSIDDLAERYRGKGIDAIAGAFTSLSMSSPLSHNY